jgi:hypothetical protein
MSSYSVLDQDGVLAEDPIYLVLHGLSRSDKTAVDYVDHIVYGSPTKITAVDLPKGHFVALVEYPAEQFNWAKGTFDRMGSFPHGVGFMLDRVIALREFGSWIYHYAASKEAVKPDWIYEVGQTAE